MNQQQRYVMQLQKKGRQRRKDQVYIIEGRKMFAELPKERLKYTCVSESFLADKDNQELLKGIEYESVKDAVFADLSDTRSPQGILAVVKQVPYTLDDMFPADRKPLLLVLDTIQDPGNLGTMIRAGEAAGITGVIMDRLTVDVYNPKVVRSTMGSLYRVPTLVTDDIKETIQAVKDRGVHAYAAHLNGDCAYDQVSYIEGTAFLIGNEANGLTEELTALADRCVQIPMCGQAESLNAAIAASILMFDAAAKRRNH